MIFHFVLYSYLTYALTYALSNYKLTCEPSHLYFIILPILFCNLVSMKIIIIIIVIIKY